MQWSVLFLLRANIDLEGDALLAGREILALLGRRPLPLSEPPSGLFSSGDLKRRRPYGICAYLLRDLPLTPDDLFCLFRRLTFVELIVGEKEGNRDEGEHLLRLIPPLFRRCSVVDGRVRFRLLPFTAVAEWADIITRRARTSEEARQALQHTMRLAVEGTWPESRDRLSAAALTARQTTGYLFHGLHVYKAKFFPRFSRFLLNIGVSSVSPHSQSPIILDPFVGSGTVLIDAAIMGFHAVGVDLDPLSVRIAGAKSLLLTETGTETRMAVAATIARLQHLSLPLFIPPVRRDIIPPFLLHRLPPQELHEITHDVSLYLAALPEKGPGVLPLQIVLSDVLSRKVRLRFLGLGYGRFSLTLSSGRVLDGVLKALSSLQRAIDVWHWLREAAGLVPCPPGVLVGDARALPFRDEGWDVVVTSPPYMPASSGRENYAHSKALAFMALGLGRENELAQIDHALLGSIRRRHDGVRLPPPAQEIIEWLASDPIRRVKAAATAAYFVDLTQALGEIYRVLRPDGCCALVVAKHHVFYRYKTRDIVRIVDNVAVVSEIARRIGFEIEETIDVQLAKQNAVARPRSRDAYYETVLFLRKP